MDIYQELPWNLISRTRQPENGTPTQQPDLKAGRWYAVHQAFFGKAVKQGEPFDLDPKGEEKWQLTGRLEGVQGQLKKISPHLIEFAPQQERHSAHLPRGLFAVTVKGKNTTIASGFQFFEIR